MFVQTLIFLSLTSLHMALSGRPVPQNLNYEIEKGLQTDDLLEWRGRTYNGKAVSVMYIYGGRDPAVPKRRLVIAKITIQGGRKRFGVQGGSYGGYRYHNPSFPNITMNKDFLIHIRARPTSLLIYWNKNQTYNIPNLPIGRRPIDIRTIRLYGRNIVSLTRVVSVISEDTLPYNFVSRECGIVSTERTPVPDFCPKHGADCRIVGGIPAAPKINPWQAAIRFRQEYSGTNDWHRCGATLIGSCWALSAAHCFPSTSNSSLSRLVVRVGDYYNEDGTIYSQKPTVERSRDLPIERVYKHEYYDNEPFPVNDIALIKLAECAEFNDFVKPACLPKSKNQFQDGISQCGVFGWGASYYGQDNAHYPRCLQTAQVMIRNVTLCREAFQNDFDRETMMCASNECVDACQGDSGGPLICDERVNRKDLYTLWGITSWGVGCAGAKPGVYTRVSKFKKWIYFHVNGFKSDDVNTQ